MNDDNIWWNVKVYDEESGTTTTMSMYAVDETECAERLAKEGLWQFVKAYPQEAQ